MGEKLFCLLSNTPYTSNHAHNVAARWGRAILNYTPGWTVDVRGQEYLLDPSQPTVMVANHESATDILAVYFLGTQFRWLSKESIFKLPLVGIAMRWAGYIPIKRGQKSSHRTALKACRQCLENKIPVLFFPEGTRSTSGSPKEFKAGAFQLADDASVPVQPLVLHGAGKLLRKKSLCPNKATVRIEVLPVVYKLEDESVSDFTQRVRTLIVNKHAELSQEAGSSI